MSIVREGQFLVWHDMAHVSGLGLESAQLDACIRAIRDEHIKGAFGNAAYFKETTLDVLRQLPDLEAIWFWDVELRNVDALYGLRGLRYFGVHPKRPAVDFSRLPSLRQVVWFHKASDLGIASLSALEMLHVWHYRPKTKGFSDFALPAGLTELKLYWANVESLDGLPALPQLRRLEVHRCRNLRRLGNIAELFPRLEHLVVAACGKVEDGEGDRVARLLPGLRHAYVKNRVVGSGDVKQK